MKKLILKLQLLLAFILLFGAHAYSQSDEGGEPNYQVPIVTPVIKDYVNFIKADCEDQVDEYDVFVDIDIIPGKHKKHNTTITPTKVYLYPLGNEQPGIWIEEDMQAELFNVKSLDGYLTIRAEAYDDDDVLWTTKDIVVPTEKDGMVRTSKKIHDDLVAWRMAAIESESTGGGTGVGTGVGPGPGVGGDIFTFFCGKFYSKVELFTFFTEYLELSEEALCKFKKLYERTTGHSWTINTGLLLWDDELCELLTIFWEDYTQGGGDDPNGGGEECNCKLIKSATHVRHSLGAEVGLAGESSGGLGCPDIPLPEEDSEWWGKGAQGVYKTDHKNNWANILWGWQGAAKMLHIHGNQEREESDMVDPNVAIGQTGEINSYLSFSMFCFDPLTLGPAFNEHCDCSKVVNVGYYYGSSFKGGALTSGSGKIKGAIEDIAVFMKVSPNGSSNELDFGRAFVEVECESNDETSVLTDVGNFVSALTTAASGFNISDIAGTLSSVDNLIGLGNQIFESHSCGQTINEPFTLVGGQTQEILTPENYSVTFILFSYATGKIFTEDDDSRVDLTLNSDYYLAGTLYSDADSDAEYCCQELVGSYAIGDLSAFTNDDLGQDKFTGLFDSPRTLADKQNAVATSILNTGGEAFGIVVFPGAGCCQPKIDCYYDCQYYGECHDDTGRGVGSNPSENSFSRNIHLENEQPVRLFPSPLEKGNYLTIENLNGHTELQSIEILNSQGMLVKMINPVATADQLLSIDLQDLLSGIYFVRYNTLKESTTNKIFIK